MFHVHLHVEPTVCVVLLMVGRLIARHLGDRFVIQVQQQPSLAQVRGHGHVTEQGQALSTITAQLHLIVR